MSAEALIQRLESVQKQGDGWRTRCPACGGRSRKLHVSQADGGRVLLHCFSGCSALEVVQAVGLTIADLFPERLAADTPEDRRRRQRLARESQWGAALELLQHEASVVAIVAGDLIAGRSLSADDVARVQLAAERISSAQATLRDEPRCSREQGARLHRRTQQRVVNA